MALRSHEIILGEQRQIHEEELSNIQEQHCEQVERMGQERIADKTSIQGLRDALDRTEEARNNAGVMYTEEHHKVMGEINKENES